MGRLNFRTDILVGQNLENFPWQDGVYLRSLTLSPRIFYPAYPENPRTLGETVRKARIDKGLVIKELARLVGADEMTVANWELRNRRPIKRFQQPLRDTLGIEI